MKRKSPREVSKKRQSGCTKMVENCFCTKIQIYFLKSAGYQFTKFINKYVTLSKQMWHIAGIWISPVAVFFDSQIPLGSFPILVL